MSLSPDIQIERINSQLRRFGARLFTLETEELRIREERQQIARETKLLTTKRAELQAQLARLNQPQAKQS